MTSIPWIKWLTNLTKLAVSLEIRSSLINTAIWETLSQRPINSRLSTKCQPRFRDRNLQRRLSRRKLGINPTKMDCTHFKPWLSLTRSVFSTLRTWIILTSSLTERVLKTKTRNSIACTKRVTWTIKRLICSIILTSKRTLKTPFMSNW